MLPACNLLASPGANQDTPTAFHFQRNLHLGVTGYTILRVTLPGEDAIPPLARR